MAEQSTWKNLFHKALAFGDVEVLRAALAAGMPLNDLCLYRAYTPLHYLAQDESATVALLQVLIDAGADVNVCMVDSPNAGDTALILAAERGRLDMVKLLLAAGTDIHATDALGSNAVGEAAKGGGTASHTAVVRELLAAGAKPDAQALLYAAWNGNPAIVGLLLDAGVDPNEPSRLGLPLQWAVGMGQIESAKMLLRAGANPNRQPPAHVRAQFGCKSALELARERGKADVVALLTAALQRPLADPSQPGGS